MSDEQLPEAQGPAPEHLGPQRRQVLLFEGENDQILGGVIPSFGPGDIMMILAEGLNQTATKLAMRGFCQEPTPEEVEEARQSIEAQMSAGILGEEARHVDPAFQLKYQISMHNLLLTMVNVAASIVEKQFKAPGSGLVLPGQPGGLIRPR
jgi:hypothetical protein